jgi:hypothetical protein
MQESMFNEVVQLIEVFVIRPLHGAVFFGGMTAFMPRARASSKITSGGAIAFVRNQMTGIQPFN